MTPLSALAAQSAAALAPDVAAMTPGSSGQTADFSALLAQLDISGAAPQSGSTAAPASAAAPAPVRSNLPAGPAIELPGGKDLPVSLPLAASSEAPVAADQTTDAPAHALSPIPPAVRHPSRCLPVSAAANDSAHADAETPAAGERTQDEAAPAPQPASAPLSTLQTPSAAFAAGPADTPPPAPEPTAPEPAAQARPAAFRPIPPGAPSSADPQARLIPIPAQMPAPLPAAGTGPHFALLAPASALPPPTAAANFRIEPDQALRVTVSADLLQRDGARLLHLSDPTAPTGDALPPFAMPAAGAGPVPLAAPLSAPLADAHDFAAVIDRLAAARDAVQPQVVSFALSHQDFGAVQLHFRHEDSGLGVTLSGSDPDLSRAVAAAQTAVGVPATESPTTAQLSSGTRLSDSGGSGQARSGSQSMPQGDRTPRGNPSPGGRAPLADRTRQGIFA